ncbi:hypothetical protein KRR40_14040 [Niabella defluvii]|nr:hypothetical protein KRR40_14040 [Niabella sp. I65]
MRLPARTRAETFGRAKIHTYFKRMIDENKSILLNDAPRGRGEKGVSYLAGFFMLIAFGVGGMLLGGLLGIPVAAAMSGKSVLFITENLSNLTGDSLFERNAGNSNDFCHFWFPDTYTVYRLAFKLEPDKINRV